MKIRIGLSNTAAVAALLSLSVAAAGTAIQAQETKAASVNERALGAQEHRLPKRYADGADLPNGWRITPAGKAFATVGEIGRAHV